MSTSKIEFAVQMTCNNCVEAVKKSLQAPEIKKVEVDLGTGAVVVESTLSTTDLLKRIETTGKKVVVKGYAGTAAGVAILDTSKNRNIQGVVRFMQIDPKTCIIDGTVDGLRPGNHALSVHECGDISNGCESVGECYNPFKYNNTGRIYGDLGTVTAQNDGRAVFRIEDNTLKLSDIIGRSLVIKDKIDSACGIIARSSGLFQNPKTICACDGVSIWDETSKPNVQKSAL